MGGGVDLKSQCEGIFKDDGGVLCFDCGGGYITECICLNHRTIHKK